MVAERQVVLSCHDALLRARWAVPPRRAVLPRRRAARPRGAQPCRAWLGSSQASVPHRVSSGPAAAEESGSLSPVSRAVLAAWVLCMVL